MSGDIEWLDVEWMAGASRGQALQALSYSLHEQADAIRRREASFVARNGGAWAPDAERLYRSLSAGASFVDAFFAYSRGVAIEIAAKSKGGAKEYHRMPPVMAALGDQLIAAFMAKIDSKGARNGEARSEVENGPQGGAASLSGVAAA